MKSGLSQTGPNAELNRIVIKSIESNNASTTHLAVALWPSSMEGRLSSTTAVILRLGVELFSQNDTKLSRGSNSVCGPENRVVFR